MSERHGKRDARPPSEPAPTLTEKARSDEWEYATQENAGWIEGDGCGDPLGLKGEDWPDRRPATTVVAGDPRVFQPGGHHGEGEQSQNAVRVTVAEAAALQSFPPDYPWAGSRTKQFMCIGNAVPPQLAFHVLRELIATPLQQKVWANVSFGAAEECWEWRGARNEHGYGIVRGLDGRTRKVHRVVMGEPDEYVLHRCDNPPCCNPAHLFLGTQADNVADMKQKGRGVRGSRVGSTQLTEGQVREIRDRHAAGESQKALCEAFGLTKGPMSALVNRRTWTHV